MASIDKINCRYIPSIITKTKTFLEKIKCDVGLMIDRGVAEKRYENKVGMSS